MKKLAKVYYSVYRHTKVLAKENKITASFTNSHSLSGDKLNYLMQLVVFAAQHGMIWVD